jgi:hypothetical protein
VEAFAATLVGIGLPAWLKVSEVGVFALFLIAAALVPRLAALLEENRVQILERDAHVMRTNAVTAASIATLFVGICAGYLVVALNMSDDDVATFFGFALSSAGLGTDTILDRSFENVGGILAHNLSVLSSVTLLCLVYRSYGALLAIGYNACQWVFVLVMLVRRASDHVDLSPLAFGALSMGAVLPHLLTEGVAYVIAALAGIFASKAITKYGPGDPVFFAVMVTCGKLLAISLGLLVLAAGLEATLVPAVQRVLAP